MTKSLFLKLSNSTYGNKLKDSVYGEFIYTCRAKVAVHVLNREISTIKWKPSGVFILGMHRSGTSCLTGILGDCGLYMGSISKENPYNKKGTQEGKASWLNSKLLRANGGIWFAPKKATIVPPHLAIQIERHYLEMSLGAYHAGKKYWVVKDPRLLFCLAAWSKKDDTLIGTIRHPAKVAASLLKRDNKFSEKQVDPWELWYEYNSELLSLYHRKPFPIVNFDWVKSRYTTAVKNIVRYHKIEEYNDSFFEADLVHNNYEEQIENLKYRNLYLELIAISELEEKRLASMSY